MSERLFDVRMTRWIFGICALSLVAGLTIMALGPTLGQRGSTGGDGYSYSALGHHAFIEVLESMGHEVLRSRFNSAERTRRGAVLVAAAPDPDFTDPSRHTSPGQLDLDGLGAYAGDAVIVLPKRAAGEDDDRRPGWLKGWTFIALERVQEMLARYDSDANLVRVAEATGCGWATEDRVLGAIDIADVQLMQSGDITPLYRCREGVLAGVRKADSGREVLVVSDADLISTWSLGKGANAEVAYGIFSDFAGVGAPFIFDETIHGHIVRPSLWRMLFEMPLVPFTLHALLVLMVALWLASRRFGAPESPPDAIGRGKSFLIANTAELLQYGGHSTSALHRYFAQSVQRASRQLNAPGRLGPDALRTWLDDVGRRQGASDTVVGLADLIQRVNQKGRKAPLRYKLRLAMRVYRWKQEIARDASSRP